ncbi:MAG: TetR/AcrR family transcriptional regulator [Gammaproteobacteria bacterium]|nr:TetR/AcrR family transcriptional regulator [Gammaproteobacteria bacterium]MDH3450271.1 TetR/AcrR family transcriptional regulator [Gammaproteobacteria bacterium]
MPWHKNYDKTQVLEKAMKAFWCHGYEGTSINDLVAATGINRGSIYASFPNKHALFICALRYYDQKYRARHLERLAAAHSPREAITAVFAEAAKKPQDEDIPWGCLLVNTALELSPHDIEVSKLVDHSLKCVEAFFVERIEAAQQEGSIRQSIDSFTTAKGLLSLFLGLRVLTRANASRTTIDAVTSQARVMLD